MGRKSHRLNKFKKINLRKKTYLTLKEKDFSKIMKSPSDDISVLGPYQILRYISDELLNEFVHGTDPIPKGLYGDLKK